MLFSDGTTRTGLVEDRARYNHVLLGCVHGRLAALAEEELLLVLLQELGGAQLIQEERVDPLDVVHLDFCTL